MHKLIAIDRLRSFLLIKRMKMDVQKMKGFVFPKNALKKNIRNTLLRICRKWWSTGYRGAPPQILEWGEVAGSIASTDVNQIEIIPDKHSPGLNKLL